MLESTGQTHIDEVEERLPRGNPFPPLPPLLLPPSCLQENQAHLDETTQASDGRNRISRTHAGGCSSQRTLRSGSTMNSSLHRHPYPLESIGMWNTIRGIITKSYFLFLVLREPMGLVVTGVDKFLLQRVCIGEGPRLRYRTLQ